MAGAIKSEWREELSGAPVSLAGRDRVLALLVGMAIRKPAR